jgi:phage terminase large subunit
MDSFWMEVLRPSLADRRGWAVFIGTPRGRNDFWRVHRHAEQHPEDWFSLVLRASETGLLPQSELDDMRQMLTPEQWDQELNCSFDAAILGSYYGRELAEAEAAGRITNVPYDPALPVHTAWDLGIGDSTAIWFFQVVALELHVIDYYEASGYGLAHYASVLSSRGYNYETEWLPHDGMAREMGTGRSRYETLNGLLNRYPRIVHQQSVMDGINATRLTIGKAWFDAAKCYDGLEALRAYRADYDEKAKVFNDRPKHDWSSHGADAARYMSLAWREMQPEKPPPPRRDSWTRAFQRANEEDVADWRII